MVKLFTKVIGGDSKNKDVDLYVDSLYRAFDRDNNGTISFEEFLLGYCLINSKDERCKLKFAFKMYKTFFFFNFG
jgi:Ca2+-binding EF-hand superfamily protein